MQLIIQKIILYIMCFVCFGVFPVVVIWLSFINGNRKTNGEEKEQKKPNVVKVEHDSLCETETYIVD